jgi:twitching motility protein PilT
MRVRELLELAVKAKASDLHLNVQCVPLMRIHGELCPVENMNPLSAKDVEALFEEITTAQKRAAYAVDHELDTNYSIPGLTRCRVNVLQQRSSLSINIRLIPFGVPTIEELNLPQVCSDLMTKSMGLILVTGPTGCGKSSTIAAMINYLNETRSSHVITIEDPIEYVYSNNRCLILQRDIGEDTASFDTALIHALRHDPDVIVLGEIRELSTMSTALRAAETGHLVIGTLHTVDCSQTINRIADMFTATHQEQIRSQLSLVLAGVICQTLVPRAGGEGRVPACEIMLATTPVRNIIREGRIHQLYSTIQVSKKDGMQTLNQALADLLMQGIISEEQAFLRTPAPDELRALCESLYHNQK